MGESHGVLKIWCEICWQQAASLSMVAIVVCLAWLLYAVCVSHIFLVGGLSTIISRLFYSADFYQISLQIIFGRRYGIFSMTMQCV